MKFMFHNSVKLLEVSGQLTKERNVFTFSSSINEEGFSLFYTIEKAINSLKALRSGS